MAKLMNAYAARIGAPVTELTFLLKNQIILPNDDAVSLEIGDDDTITCIQMRVMMSTQK